MSKWNSFQNSFFEHNLTNMSIKQPIKSFRSNVKELDDPSITVFKESKFTISESKPPQCPFPFITQFSCPPQPLTYETFLSRREQLLHQEDQNNPFPIPSLGCKAAAVLMDIPVMQADPKISYRANSPETVNGIVPMFVAERTCFIGRPRPSPAFTSLVPLMSALSGFRTLHLMINFPGFVSANGCPKLSTGFVSDDELVSALPVRPFEPFCQQVSFTSRWQVDLLLSEAAFSVHTFVQGFQWLVVAPLHICYLIQSWANSHNQGKPALIRMHPNMTEAFQELSLALAPDHELLFLSPSKDPDMLSQMPGIGMYSHSPDSLPDDLPSGPSEAFFPPVSMLITSPNFDTADESRDQTFSVIYTDFGNSPVRLRRCNGRAALREFWPKGYSFVVPFHEAESQYINTLVYDLMEAMPYFCWPCHALSSRHILDRMEPSLADQLHCIPVPSGDGGQA